MAFAAKLLSARAEIARLLTKATARTRGADQRVPDEHGGVDPAANVLLMSKPDGNVAA
jgi:hypothetical protein